MMQEARSSSVLRLSGQHALMYATLNTSYEAAPSPPGNPVTKIVAGSSSTRDVGSSVARRCKHILCLRMGALWPHKTWSGITAQQSVTCSVLALGGSGTRPRGLCAAVGLRRSTRSADRPPKEGVCAQGSVAGISGPWAGGLQEIVPADARVVQHLRIAGSSRALCEERGLRSRGSGPVVSRAALPAPPLLRLDPPQHCPAGQHSAACEGGRH